MKKLAIAGASAVLAALPVVGAFAANSSSFTDHINVTVDGGCTIENAATASTNPGVYEDRNFSASIAAGTYKVLTGREASGQTPATPAPALVVKCNVTDTNKTFNITAEGEALTHTDNTTTIPVGTATDGSTSAWAYSLNSSESSPTWANAPVAETTVVSNIAANTSTSYSFNPVYRVYVSPSQKPGDYSGSITYTVAIND